MGVDLEEYILSAAPDTLNATSWQLEYVSLWYCDHGRRPDERNVWGGGTIHFSRAFGTYLVS